MTRPESILNLRYGISGDRMLGAHPPVTIESSGSEQDLLFKSALVLQRPVLDPCLAVGFLPLSSEGLRVGQLITMKWRIERLNNLQENEDFKCNVSHEIIPDSMNKVALEIPHFCMSASFVQKFGRMNQPFSPFD